jgi:hypothetical protein
MNYENTRKDIRYPCTLHASYLVLGEPSRPQDTSVAKADVMDLSIGGIRIRNSQLLRKGSLVQVRVPVSGEHTVPVISEVRWAMEETLGNFQTGLKFLI